MATLGQRLKEERLKRGLSIETLAAQTRIHASYFEAIEKDDVSGLPGGFFYRSFVKQYARLMDLPESVYLAEIQRSLDEEASVLQSQETVLPDRQIDLPPIPTGRTDAMQEMRRWLLRLGALALVILVCSGVYTFWQRWQTQSAEAQKAAEAAQKVQEPVKAAVQTPPKPALPVQTPPQQEPPPAATEPPKPAETSPLVSEPSGGVRLIVKAKELAWLAVWQGDRLLFGDVIPAGESRGFGAPDRLRVRFGNAGGVEIQWNGQAVPPIGPRGQVRTVDFRGDGYTVIVPPVKPAETPSVPQP